MLFASTRNKDEVVNYQEAIFRGLADDGGLYHQVECPDLSEVFASFDKSWSFNEISEKVAYSLLKDELSEEQVKNIIKRAFDFTPKITEVEKGLSILELYHGPSSAFKDFGASFLASSMEEFLLEREDRAIILTATSGDTGSAVARAFYKKKNIDVVILYPSKRVSPLQEKQLTTLGENIFALEVEGSFDDCQRMVKEAFLDKELKRKFNLTSANSINLGRLIPQSFYYIWAWAQQKNSPEDKVDNLVFCVPSGNFGNLTAGILAKKWGLSIDHFLAATNKNDVVPEYLLTGEYKPRASEKTLSNAMDVGAPSNFERMQAIYNHSQKNMVSEISGQKITDEQTLESMKNVYKKYNNFLCPHTAVGFMVAEKYWKNHQNKNVITLSTAHPSKFLEVVKQATEQEPPLAESIVSVMNLEKKSKIIDNKTDSLKKYLKENF